MSSPTIARPLVCPDPSGHRRLRAGSETWWRLSAEQRRRETADGTCPWCPGKVGAA